MGRMHLFEIHEQPWLPRSLRDGITDYLRFIIDIAQIYSATVPLIKEALEEVGTHTIIDLCSGGAGPWTTLHAALEETDTPVNVCLTDKFPNLDAFAQAKEASGGKVGFRADSIDAMDLPEDLHGFRTLFSSFHHFKPEMARAILADAVKKRQGIGIFEATPRRLSNILPLCFSPLAVMAATPFIRPFRLSRLLWTYFIPAIPSIVGFDGVVSSLRTYTPSELLELSAGLGGADYRWQSGELKSRGKPPVIWLIGVPRRESLG